MANTRQIKEQLRRKSLVTRYQTLLGTRNRNEAAAHMGESRSSLDRYLAAYQAGGDDALLPGRSSGRKRKFELLPKELEALTKNVLTTNRTRTSGSKPEAIRMAARQGELRPELVEELQERDRHGRMLTDSLADQLKIAAPYVKHYRSPKDANLDYLNSPGTMMWTTDPDTGEDRFIKAGDILEADDATINFPVCIPWELGGDPCSERWGVKVARFQWLVAIDAATRFVPGFSYTARPRDSYRAEDITAFYHRLFRQHGMWSRIRNERGSWEARQVLDMVQGLEIQRITAWSPHQKPFIEGLFNLMWTKLSDVPGQVGRYRGETEKENKTLTSCRRGATDPREHFPMIADALQALSRVVAERNRQPVHSREYGSWVPEERWLSQHAEARQSGRLIELPSASDWMFAPVRREWKVKGNTIGGSVQIMQGYSLRFDFAAEWLIKHTGETLKVYFDPTAPGNQCKATLVRRGEVLGKAIQVNKVARYARRVIGWGEDLDMGLDQRKKGASALRRETRIIGAGGQVLASSSEARNGLGDSATIEHSAPARSAVETGTAGLAPMPKDACGARGTGTAGGAFSTATEEEFTRQQTRLDRGRAARERIAARLAELQET